MAWLRLTLGTKSAQSARALELLAELGSAAQEEVDPEQVWRATRPDDVRLRAWFEGPDAEAIGARLHAELGDVQLTWETVPEDTDWAQAWKEQWKPIVISERLVLAPPWDAPAGSLVIEPGQGFGTGHHPTTRLMLRALDALADGARAVLDVGCGSGVLALAAARLGLEARGVDIHAEAVNEARANAERNGLPARFSTTPVAELRAGPDVVLANLHAEVLIPLAPDLIRLTQQHLVLCGILADREKQVRAAFAALSLAERVHEDPWVLLHYKRD